MIPSVALVCRSSDSTPHPPTHPIQLFLCLMLHILSFFGALAVRDTLLSFLLRMCESERKSQCSNLRGILSLKDRVQLCGHTHTHTYHTLTHSHSPSCLSLGNYCRPCSSCSLQSSHRSHEHLPAPAIFSWDRGPLHGLITASTDQPLPLYFHYSTSPPPLLCLHSPSSPTFGQRLR